MNEKRPYRGRFAPSPTGPLHFGSLIAAVASYADALHHNGQWLLRIEDVDETRSVAGADQQILSTLERYGFEWDSPIVYQSQRKQHYQAIIQELIERDLAYLCSCTRKEIHASGTPGAEGIIYPGTCRNGAVPGKRAVSVRLRTNAFPICFDDRIQGRQCQQLETEVGDFLIRRGDGYTAYQLAVVIDDAQQQITQVVRGSDLLFSTPRQIFLQRLLGYPTPSYAHLPIAVDADGRKLSKQGQAPAVDEKNPLRTLSAAWHFLGQPAPDSSITQAKTFWGWAKTYWDIKRIPTGIAIQV